MDLLPLLARHGAAVWIAALVTMVLGAALADLRRRRRAARTLAASCREALGAPVTHLDGAGGALVTLRGRLEAHGALCPRFEDGAPVAAASAGSGRAEAIAAARAERLELWTRGGVVRLDGPVDVVVGEVETRTGKTPQELGAAVRARIERSGGEWASLDPVVLRSVGAGVEVLVQGVLHRGDDGDGPGGYRTGGGALRLAPPPVGEDGASAGLRLAYDAGPRRSRATLGGPLRAAGAALSIFGVVFLAAPEIQGRRPIHGETVAALLAATPLHRVRAVAAYTAMLDEDLRHGPMDQGRLEELLALRLDDGRADQAVGLLLDHGQWARAEALAVRSGLPILAARAAFERGDFERAARLWDEGSLRTVDGMDLVFGLRVHLLSGDLDGARIAAQRAADALGDGKLGCIAEALGGDGARDPTCAAFLAHPDFSAPSPHPRTCFTSLPIVDPLLGPGRAPPQGALILEALEAIERAPDPTELDLLGRARLAAAMAAFESAAGEHGEALRWAGVMSASAEAVHKDPVQQWDPCSLSRSERDRFEAVRVSVMLRAGRVEEARRILAPLGDPWTARLAAAIALPVTLVGDPDAMRIEAMERALARPLWSASPADPPVQIGGDLYNATTRGDGAGFVALAQHDGVSPETLVRVVGFTNHDARGRDALLAWARWGTVERCHGCDVASRFDDLTARLALAEELGDAGLAAEIRPIVASFRRAILRRATAVPLLAVEELRMTWTPPVELALGDRHSCARFADGTVRCWGANDHGQLGDGTTERGLTPAVVPGLDGVEQIAAGGDDTCARLRDGTVRCWGAGEDHDAGSGTMAPAAVPGVARATSLAVGHDEACAVLEDGAVVCWEPRRGRPATPVRFPGEAPRVRSLTMGAFHRCASLADASVDCWGMNDRGQLGLASIERVDVPTPVPGLTGVTQVSAGDDHTCALRKNTGQILCWGAGDKGELGDRKAHSRSSPEEVSSIWRPEAVALGGSFGCALEGDTVSCWGAGARGQIGNGETDSRDAPVSTGFCGIAQVAAGGAHACMRTKSGEIWCWGANRDGQVGDGTTLDHLRPSRLRL